MPELDIHIQHKFIKTIESSFNIAELGLLCHDVGLKRRVFPNS
jgi:hypothetical protein